MATTISADKRTETTITYRRVFRWRGEGQHGGGFGFECDEHGVPLDLATNPCGADSFRKCTDGTYDVEDLGVEKDVRTVNLCTCGSGLWPERVYDARGIYVCKCCEKCRAEKMRGFRPEIFTDPGYDTYGERVDED